MRYKIKNIIYIEINFKKLRWLFLSIIYMMFVGINIFSFLENVGWEKWANIILGIICLLLCIGCFIIFIKKKDSWNEIHKI